MTDVMPLTGDCPHSGYTPRSLRTLEEIQAEVLALERDTEGLLPEIVGDQHV